MTKIIMVVTGVLAAIWFFKVSPLADWMALIVLVGAIALTISGLGMWAVIGVKHLVWKFKTKD